MAIILVEEALRTPCMWDFVRKVSERFPETLSFGRVSVKWKFCPEMKPEHSYALGNNGAQHKGV